MRCWMVICYTRRRVDVVILDGERNGRRVWSKVTPPPAAFLRVASIHDIPMDGRARERHAK